MDKKANIRKTRWRINHPERVLFRAARERAKKNGLDFLIEEEDIQIPDVCPVFGIPLRIHFGEGKNTKGASQYNDSPTVDRIDSSKGYVKGNVWVISWRANWIKNNASLTELEMLVDALKKKASSILP